MLSQETFICSKLTALTAACYVLPMFVEKLRNLNLKVDMCCFLFRKKNCPLWEKINNAEEEGLGWSNNAAVLSLLSPVNLKLPVPTNHLISATDSLIRQTAFISDALQTYFLMLQMRSETVCTWITEQMCVFVIVLGRVKGSRWYLSDAGHTDIYLWRWQDCLVACRWASVSVLCDYCKIWHDSFLLPLETHSEGRWSGWCRKRDNSGWEGDLMLLDNLQHLCGLFAKCVSERCCCCQIRSLLKDTMAVWALFFFFYPGAPIRTILVTWS